MNRINRLRFKEYIHSKDRAYQSIVDAVRPPNIVNEGRWRYLDRRCIDYLFEVCKPYWEVKE